MPKSEFMPDGELDGAQPVSMATAVGSNNDRLWTEMAVLGG